MLRRTSAYQSRGEQRRGISKCDAPYIGYIHAWCFMTFETCQRRTHITRRVCRAALRRRLI